MRKKIISIVAVLILCVLVFPACLYSDKATIKDCYTLYYKTIDKYKTKEVLTSINNGDFTFNVLTIDYSTNKDLQDEINKTDSYYSILSSDGELETLLNNSLQFFRYYKEHLCSTLIEDNVPQKLKTNLYKSIENFAKSIENFEKAKSVLCSTFVKDKGEQTLIKDNFNVCVINYFNLVKASLQIGQATKNIVMDRIPYNQETLKVSDARNAVLNVSLQYTKLITNYYEQYIQMNGYVNLKLITELSTIYNNYLTIMEKVKLDVTNFKADTTSSIIDETIVPYINKTINQVNVVEQFAGQMEIINKELGEKSPTKDENKRLYYLNEEFNQIPQKEIIISTLTNALSIYNK